MKGVFGIRVPETPRQEPIEPAYPEPEPADMDWKKASALMMEGWRALFRANMSLAGTSGQDVYRITDVTRSGDGSTVTLDTPHGAVTIRLAANGSGSIVIQIAEPPPEPEYAPQPEAAPEPVSSHQEGGYYANAWAEPVVVTNGEQSVRCWDFASTDPEPEAVATSEHATGDE